MGARPSVIRTLSLQGAQRLADAVRIANPYAATRRAPYRIFDRGLSHAFRLGFLN
jgi:hypothetical protein